MDRVYLTGIVGVDITAKGLEGIDFKNTELIINSDGGSLYESWAIHDLIKGKVKSIGVVGMCASAATQILLAAENRWSTPNSRFLIHNPYTKVEGDAAKLQETANNLQKEQDILNQRYSEYLNKPLNEIEAITSKNKPLTAKEAISINLINEIKEMDEKKVEGVFAKMENVLNTMMNFFSPKNLVMQDVNGVELNFEGIETIDQIAEGAKVTANGSPANGSYIGGDGTEYVCENGTLTAITPKVAENVEALKKENEGLKLVAEQKATEVQNLKSELEAIQNKHKEIELQFNTVKSEFSDFKNQFSKGEIKGATPETAPKEKAGLDKAWFEKL